MFTVVLALYVPITGSCPAGASAVIVNGIPPFARVYVAVSLTVMGPGPVIARVYGLSYDVSEPNEISVGVPVPHVTLP